MTSTYIHLFSPDQRLVLVITEDFPREHFCYTWKPDLQTVDQMDALLDEYVAWVDFHADLLMEEGFHKGMRFEATCGFEWEIRRKQIAELAN